MCHSLTNINKYVAEDDDECARGCFIVTIVDLSLAFPLVFYYVLEDDR